MRPGDRSVDDLIDAILDGTPGDWPAAESCDGPERPLIRQLRVLAGLAEFHRAGAPPAQAGNANLPPYSNANDKSGVQWGHLRLVEAVGRGSFGEVYRAWDTRLDREVALKLLPAEPAGGNRAASALIEEGKLLARVRHPNVVTIYGAEQIGDRIGLWMELVRGRTLEQILQERGRVGSTEAIGIGIELCRAIAAVHGVGLLHRDIKTQNVMRADDGRIVLMDFGVSREIDRDGSSDLAGTPLYLAPEVLGGGQASIQSDIYSLGVLIYRLLTGSYPVRGRTLTEVHQAHERAAWTSVRSVARSTPRGLARVIDRATDPRAERRYQSAEDLGAALRRLQPRQRPARLTYAAGSAAAFMLLVGLSWEVAGRQAGFAVRPSAFLTVPSKVHPVDRGGIAGAPLENLSGEPSVEYVSSLMRSSDTTGDTYQLYLQAQRLIERRGLFNAQEAIRKLERVIERDPQFAAAHAGLAIAYAFRSFPFRGISFDTAFPVMRSAAVKALELDPTLPEGHAAMGWVHTYEQDWSNAQAAFQRAIELNPTSTEAYTSYSISTLQPLEKYDEALRLLRIAERHDPLSLDVQREIGLVQFYSGRYAEAVETFQRISMREPEFPFVATYLARALTLAGRIREAFPLLEPGYPSLALAHVRSGRRAEAERLAFQWRDYPYQLTVIAAALGDTERAVEALERAAAAEPHRIGKLLIQPELAPLREHPRVREIRNRFGLPR